MVSHIGGKSASLWVVWGGVEMVCHSSLLIMRVDSLKCNGFNPGTPLFCATTRICIHCRNGAIQSVSPTVTALVETRFHAPTGVGGGDSGSGAMREMGAMDSHVDMNLSRIGMLAFRKGAVGVPEII